MRELTLTDMERLGAFDEAERTFQMTEEAFRTFYELTARPVRVYLARMTGDDRLADDLLQETYYRFLRANQTFDSDDHRRNYLFRIATNLVHDHRRKPFLEVPATAVPERRDGSFATVHVPELPPRVVALTSVRRPAPSGATKALFDVVRAVLPARALEQAGVRLGSDAFPLLRSAR